VTLGGFDSRRIQYARIRMRMESTSYVPMNELAGIGRSQLQKRSDITRLYSQAAGLTDMLMNDDQGAMQPKLIEFLKLIYTGRKIKNGAFEKVIGYSYGDLDARYKEHLKVNSDLVAHHLTLPSTRTELSLSGAALDDSAFAEIGKCNNLNWLDLSGSTISDERIKQLAGCKKLAQLFLVECRLDRGALPALSQFENLNELDLSGSSVVDQELDALAALDRLATLRLIATHVSDAGLLAIENLPNLRTLYLSRSQVSDAGIAKLKQKLPNLEVIK
jgi:Leucine-rich repeat (LRR) protein